jgi:hypothetical protein
MRVARTLTPSFIKLTLGVLRNPAQSRRSTLDKLRRIADNRIPLSQLGEKADLKVIIEGLTNNGDAEIAKAAQTALDANFAKPKYKSPFNERPTVPLRPAKSETAKDSAAKQAQVVSKPAATQPPLVVDLEKSGVDEILEQVASSLLAKAARIAEVRDRLTDENSEIQERMIYLAGREKRINRSIERFKRGVEEEVARLEVEKGKAQEKYDQKVANSSIVQEFMEDIKAIESLTVLSPNQEAELTGLREAVEALTFAWKVTLQDQKNQIDSEKTLLEGNSYITDQKTMLVEIGNEKGAHKKRQEKLSHQITDLRIQIKTISEKLNAGVDKAQSIQLAIEEM